MRALTLAAATVLALAGLPAFAQGIYTCVDAKGRKLTSDRPIAECIDREQKEITPAGTVLRRIGPSLTAEERAAEEEKSRMAAEERSRQLEERRKDRALLSRYPDKSIHDRERASALETVDVVIATAHHRIEELLEQRHKLAAELEFFKGDIAKAPPRLKRQIDDTETQLGAQQRFIDNQELEKQRINARYDQELARLRVLWLQHVAVAARSTASAPLRPASAASARK